MIYGVIGLLFLCVILLVVLIHVMGRRDNERIVVTIAGGMYPTCQGCCVSCEDPRVQIRRADDSSV